MEGGLGQEQKVRVLPIRVGPPASYTLCCQVGRGQLSPPFVCGRVSLTTSQCQAGSAHPDGE